MHIEILREIREKHYFGTSVYIVDLTNIKKNKKRQKKSIFLGLFDFSLSLH